MKKVYDLKALQNLDSMHDQRINCMELKEKKLILHYTKLHHNKITNFHSCDVVFWGVEEADVFAEVRKKTGLNVEGTGYYDMDFLRFIENNQYSIETIRYYHSYGIVIIQAVLVGENAKYYDDCIIRISAEKVSYIWK